MADDTAAATAEETAATTAGETTTTDDELETVLKDAQNPDAVKNAIDRQKAEAKAAKQRAAELETELQQLRDRDKTDQQRKDEAAAEALKRAEASESKLLRYEVAAAKGVPLEDAHRLVGSTKEELEQDAEQLAKRLGRQSPPPDFGGGARASANNTGDMDSMIRSSARR